MSWDFVGIFLTLLPDDHVQNYKDKNLSVYHIYSSIVILFVDVHVCIRICIVKRLHNNHVKRWSSKNNAFIDSFMKTYNAQWPVFRYFNNATNVSKDNYIIDRT